MEIFDAGSNAKGFIAVGQQATGFIAIGQMATGVIAIGQLARGVFVIGQLAVGLVGWGQAGVGIFHAAGMVGIGGRRGIGGVLQVVPSLGRARVPPQATTVQMVNAGVAGWLELELCRDQLGLGLYDRGQRTPIKLDRRCLAGGMKITEEGTLKVWAFTKRMGSTLVCERIAHVPPRPYEKKSFLPMAIVQVAMLLAMGIAYWPVVGNELIDFFAKSLPSPPAVTAPSPPAKPPAPPKTYVPPRR